MFRVDKKMLKKTKNKIIEEINSKISFKEKSLLNELFLDRIHYDSYNNGNDYAFKYSKLSENYKVVYELKNIN